ncbi:centrosome-associated protein 350 [Antennarius striatus]|uniref:centrosome-associated protein 350 n=1 Tax=Antennarius striatus TaxID=241820 RepID=UPI0035B013F1
MKSSRQTEVSLKSSSQQHTNHNIGAELTTTWKSLGQSKAALRHIENRLEATSGTGVFLDSVMVPPKKMSSKMVSCRDGQQTIEIGGSANHVGYRQQSLEKGSSRSPLKNTTQDRNVRRNNCVEFKEPLVSYREATPPSSQLEACSLQPVPGSSCSSTPSNSLVSQLVYQRDNRDRQAEGDLDSTRSSALESTKVRYLNEQPALVTLRASGQESPLPNVAIPARNGSEEQITLKAQAGMDSEESSPFVVPSQESIHRGESTSSSSPGSASQRLENLKRHHHDKKLEKLKERIRRQRQHLEEAAERDKLLGHLEQPVIAAVERSNDGSTSMPIAKIRKVAAAPPAPIYKGFTSTETKIQTPDRKVWKEDEFHNLSREIYRDLSQQFAECTRSGHQQQRERRADRSKERRPSKHVRKVQRVAPSSDLNAKSVISPASWREGQKLVNMVLQKEDIPQAADTKKRTESNQSINPRSESKLRSRPTSTERSRSRTREKPKNHSKTTSTPLSADRDKARGGVTAEQLSADIQDILDDLQLEYKAAEEEDRACQRSHGGNSGSRGRGESRSQARTPISAWGTTLATGGSSRSWRSASPTTRRPETAKVAKTGQKKRHYDADSVRQYISRQQEERKKRQAEEKRALREEAESKNKRLQELYRKQRQVAKAVVLPSEVSVAPVQKRLQETYTKLLLEGAQMGEEATQTQPAATSSQMRPMFQPSGESDKENKRLEAPGSPSSSDRSLNDQLPPPLTRDNRVVRDSRLLQPDHLSPAGRPVTGARTPGLSSFDDRFLSHLLRLETAMAPTEVQQIQQPARTPSNGVRPKMSRIEAVKATAASLSNRIENEARKLAGQGINYGAVTTMNVDSVLAPGPSQDNLDESSWTRMACTENNDVALRIQRILTNTGCSSYNGTTLPGAGNRDALRGRIEMMGTSNNVPNAVTTSAVEGEPVLDRYAHEKRKTGNSPVSDLTRRQKMNKMTLKKGNGLMEEMERTDHHDSSASSISEGPLSEAGISEDEASPPHLTSNHTPRPADRLEAVNYCSGQRRDFQRLSEFQREASMCSALSSPIVQRDSSKAAWEELNKGSPLSVINIFTKNLHGHVKASERNSPSAHSLLSGNDPVEAVSYEDDFVSTQSSGASGPLKRGSNSCSMNSHFEELMRRSPYERSSGGIDSHHSSLQSSHLSSGSPSATSPFSNSYSARKRGTASDQSDATLVEEQRSCCSPPSEPLSSESRKRGSDKSSPHSKAKSLHSNETSDETSHLSKKTTSARPKHGSPNSSGPGSPPGADSLSEPVKSGSLGKNKLNTSTTSRGGRTETKTTGELQYSPAVLQQRMAAELHYLESIEESVRQLGDFERLMGVTVAQQESASLAQMLKTKQQRHEQDLYELKIKAEREALETQLQLEENRQRLAWTHIELQESLAGTQKQTLEGLQEASTKMMSQQAQAAQYTAEAARHIKEMTHLARSHVEEAFSVHPVPAESSVMKQEEHQNFFKQQQDKIDSDSLVAYSFQREVSNRRMSPAQSSLNSTSHSGSLSFRKPKRSGAESVSHHSLSHVSSDSREQIKKEAAEGNLRKAGAERTKGEAGSSSIEDEVLTAANDSLCSDHIPSIANDKADSASIATEYSLKFDESMTEDEIEERSFRSLLPSEAHRRGSKEKSRHQEESEDAGVSHSTSVVSGSHNIFKSQDANKAFSGGQDSFSQFTMDMVRQYMKDEEVRLQHQSSLLHLRQKALKEKTRTELAWLEHQKKRLRDKGEDDKMPPLRKKQRGLLLKLQQEQAEIKRLQEANKAARKERQLLLKQQEEIERMRNSTLRLKERLKCAGGEPQPEGSASETPVSEAAFPNIQHAEDVRSPSPSPSISGSETSSIMQKLKKMRSQMDEKHCSPVHYFFSVFTAHHWASLSVCLPNLHPKFQLFIYNQLVRFLTKREQQLMQRRHYAVELLQWKQRLDQEEVEVQRMEKEALAVWDRQTPLDKEIAYGQKKEGSDISPIPHRSSEPRTVSGKDHVSEGNSFSETPESSINTEGLEQEPGSPSSGQALSIPEKSLASIQSIPANYTEDMTSGSLSPNRQSPFKGSHSPTASPSDDSSKAKMQLRSSSRTTGQPHTPIDPPIAMHTEPISDQSDIESRIKALREEVRKRKFMAYQLKKEQKKRHQERLKAQEASLLKQLQSYDDLIEKTKAEMNKEPDTPDISQIKDSTSRAEQHSVNTPTNRSEVSKISNSERMQADASLDHIQDDLQQNDSRSTPVPKGMLITEQSKPSSKEAHIQMIESDNKIESHEISERLSEIQEELEEEATLKSKDQNSESLLKLSGSKDSQKEMAETDKSEPEHSNFNFSNDTHSAVDLVNPPHPSYRPSSNGHYHSPKSVPYGPKESLIMDTEASSATADGYHDDFESPVNSSTRDDHSSKPASYISVSPCEIKISGEDSPCRATPVCSQDKETKEEIPEELSYHSDISGNSQQSGRRLGLHNQTEDTKHDRTDIVNHSPTISPLQPRFSPVEDEMSDFNIGDRVLVGYVQPGTLRFKGSTSFANGFWAGVELDKSEGSNNGTYDGVVYFECDKNHGIFAPPDKVTHLPDKLESYTDNTEDEDSFFDDLPDKGEDKPQMDEEKGDSKKEKEQRPHNKFCDSKDKKLTDESGFKVASHFNSRHHKESKDPISNGTTEDIIFNSEDAPTAFLISDMGMTGLKKRSQKKISSYDETEERDSQPAALYIDVRDDKGEQKDRVLQDKCVDKLVNNFVRDTVKKFAEMKKAKEQKIGAANEMNGDLFHENGTQEWFSSVEQKDGLPFFLPTEQEELSSPELCNRPESPVLGASGQEKLAKRLAELELSRELLDDIGDDQDWFDEDFGLSSRREQQRLKQKREEEARLGRGGGLEISGSSAGVIFGGLVSSGGEQQVKTPPRPELPLPLPPKLPEQPAMVVPHSTTEVEKLVHAATQEIWESCRLGEEGAVILEHLPAPKPSQEYLGKEAGSQDEEALCIRSYRKAVYDLTWEILREIFVDIPSADQPRWLKPRRVKSSPFHRVKALGDVHKIKEFIAAEVLKLYGLRKDQTQKTDWQKMLKFGRKKRDRVDHILVQELHEEETQWVYYDEDELFVKMQLADSIFDSLLKDTANILTVIYDNRANRDTLS